MNTLLDPAVTTMPDVQSGTDTRRVPIQRVGVRGVRHPLLLASGKGQPQTTIAQWEMTVALPAEEKGTHMSRFIDLLEAHRAEPMTPAGLCAMAQGMLDRLHAEAGDVVADFPYFMEKSAPVSGVRSLMDYQVRWSVHVHRDQGACFSLRLRVPVTSLCPCSKAISEYGAHNQRSHVTASLTFLAVPTALDLDTLIQRIEAQGSSELWGLLKRADEKYVTERAYENPKFVEDLVRDVAVLLQHQPGVSQYEVTAENFESIHNHSAYAVVSSQ
ncbi:MAG TPA: GTP cyclohydrolase FolE2 [Castellaniella sp.]|uniref:GTP cyclohydrolase FolE2 n=1 Tax=Castellaniella sp. TaxID=1955812 RepID=UPI002F0B926B